MLDLIENIKIILILVLIPVGSVLILFILSKLPELWKKLLSKDSNSAGDLIIPPVNTFNNGERIFYLFISVVISAIFGILATFLFLPSLCRGEELGCMGLIVLIPFTGFILPAILIYPVYFIIKKVLKKT